MSPAPLFPPRGVCRGVEQLLRKAAPLSLCVGHRQLPCLSVSVCLTGSVRGVQGGAHHRGRVQGFVELDLQQPQRL